MANALRIGRANGDLKCRLADSAKVTQAELEELTAAICPQSMKAGLVVGLWLDDTCWENIYKIKDIVEFQGFNPKKLANEVLERVDAYDKNEHPLKELAIDGTTCKYTEKETTLDIFFMITIFLIRGNSVPKILATISSEVRGVVTRKLSALGISVTKTEKRLTSTSVTLARLSQTFSSVTAVLILKKQIEGKLQPKWLLGSTLPLIMQHSIFSGLVPRDIAAFSDLREIAIALNLEMTVMLQVPKE